MGVTLRHPTPKNRQRGVGKPCSGKILWPRAMPGQVSESRSDAPSSRYPRLNTQRPRDPTPTEHPTPKNRPTPIVERSSGKVVWASAMPYPFLVIRSDAWSRRCLRPNTQRPGARFGGDPAPPNALGPNAPKSTAPDRRAVFREVNMTIRDAVTADSSRAAHRVVEVSVFQHPTPKAPLGQRGFKRT